MVNPPKHVAIIMDGNGRWAELRGRPRIFGHIKGARVAKKVIEWCKNRRVAHLTLYSFSKENWQRPEPEIRFLFSLLCRHLPRERHMLIENDIRFDVIGQIDRLPDYVQLEIEKTREATAGCSGMVLTLALSFSGRQDIVDCTKELAKKVRDGSLQVDDINEATFSSHLPTHHLPEPDLIIRTGGELRLSNFFLWQAAYSELYVSPLHWPEFDELALDQALRNFDNRERRFGMTSSQVRPVIARDLQ